MSYLTSPGSTPWEPASTVAAMMLSRSIDVNPIRLSLMSGISRQPVETAAYLVPQHTPIGSVPSRRTTCRCCLYC